MAKNMSKRPGPHIPHQEGAHKTADNENAHGHNVVLLGEYFSFLFSHSLAHEIAGSVVNNKSPAHDLGAHIEKLGHNPFPVTGNGKDPFKGGNEIDGMVRISISRHLHHGNEDKHHDDDDPDDDIGRTQNIQVAHLHCFKFLRAQLRSAAAVSMGSSLAWIKVLAMNIPVMEPMGLKDWARLRRWVEDSSAPMERI